MALTQITSEGIKDATIDTEDIGNLVITNAKVATSAAIAGTKISPDFGSQNILTTGKLGVGTTSLNSVFPVTIQAQYPGIQFLDAQGTDSFGINADGGVLKLQVGVGGSGPSQVLQIATASTTITNNLNANAGLDVSGNTTFAHGNRTLDLTLDDNPSTGDVGCQFRAGASDFLGLAAGAGTGIGLVVDDSNKVGIGIINPDELLHIKDTATNCRLKIENTNNTVAGVIFKNSVQEYAIQSNVNNLIVYDTTDSATRIQIDTDGRVQIGSTNNSATGTKLVVGSGNNMAATALINTQDTDINALTLSNWDGATTSNKVLIGFDNSGRGSFSLGMPAATNAFAFFGSIDGSSNEFMRITSTGKIGIGTTPGGTPANKNAFLAIGDSDTGIVQDGDGQFEIFANAVEVANFNAIDGYTSSKNITTTGSVGIGTTSPGYPLDVQAASGDASMRLRTAGTGTGDDTILRLQVAGTTQDNFIYFGDADDSNAGQINYNHNSNFLRFFTNAGERVRIDSDGTIFSFSENDTTPNIKWRSDDTNWFGSLNQSVEGATISTFLSTGGDWSANGTTYSATKAIANFETRAIVLHPQFNNGAGKVAFLQKAAGSSTTDGTVTEILKIDNDGIKFGTDTAAANAIDDYEEGSWTPTVKFGGPSGTAASVTASGKYTKIGNLVHVTYQIAITNLNGGTGAISVGSLPFSASQSPSYSHGNLQGNSSKSLPNTAGSTMPYFETNLSTFRILFDTPTSHGDVQHSHFPANTIIYGDGDFFTA